jgi:hypothetical protein
MLPSSEIQRRVVCSHLLHAGFLLGWLSNPEDGGDKFFRNVCWHEDYTALYPRRWQHSDVSLRTDFRSDQMLIFEPWRWRRYVPSKRRLTWGLHGAISQEMATFRCFSIGPDADFRTLKMEAIRSFETPFNMRTTQRYIPGDGNIQMFPSGRTSDRTRC